MSNWLDRIVTNEKLYQSLNKFVEPEFIDFCNDCSFRNCKDYCLLFRKLLIQKNYQAIRLEICKEIFKKEKE